MVRNYGVQIFRVYLVDVIDSFWTPLSNHLGLFVQSIVSLMSSLVVKILTVLVSRISDSSGIFAEKM